MHNENQPRTADGRFGTVPQSESDVELTADAQLPEWRVRDLARPGGPAVTVRASDPEAAQQQVLDELGITNEGTRKAHAKLLKVAGACQQPEDGQGPELKKWGVEFSVPFHGEGGSRLPAKMQTTVEAPDEESAKLAVYDRHTMDLWQRVRAENTMIIGEVVSEGPAKQRTEVSGQPTGLPRREHGLNLSRHARSTPEAPGSQGPTKVFRVDFPGRHGRESHRIKGANAHIAIQTAFDLAQIDESRRAWLEQHVTIGEVITVSRDPQR